MAYRPKDSRIKLEGSFADFQVTNQRARRADSAFSTHFKLTLYPPHHPKDRGRLQSRWYFFQHSRGPRPSVLYSLICISLLWMMRRRHHLREAVAGLQLWL